MNKQTLYTLNNIAPISQTLVQNGDETNFVVSHSHLIFALNVLKNHVNCQYSLLTSVSGVDLLSKSYRFCVVYELLSLVNNSRLRVKTYVNEVTPVNTATSVYSCANWWEREVWDMYGVFFQGHPDIRRILTDYGFYGHPLRKDFPLSGFVELRYDSAKKGIVMEPVQLAQEYRSFSHEIQW